MTALNSTQRFQEMTIDKTQDMYKALDNSMSLLIEEFNELAAGIEKEDKGNVVKEIMDCITVLVGMTEIAGVKAEDALQVVNESNHSKFCIDEREAIDAIAEFQRIGVDVEARMNYEPFIGIYSTCNQKLDGTVYTKDKLLKPSFYKPVDESQWR